MGKGIVKEVRGKGLLNAFDIDQSRGVSVGGTDKARVSRCSRRTTCVS